MARSSDRSKIREARERREQLEAANVLCGGMDAALRLDWDEYASGLRPWGSGDERTNKPPSSVFKTLRPHLRHWFVGPALSFACSLHNFGLKFTGSDIDPGKEAEIRRFVGRAWYERLGLNNVLALWTPKTNPIVLRPECAEDYSYSMGAEVLKYRVALTPDELKVLPEVLRQRYKGGVVRLADPEWNRLNPPWKESVRVWRDISADTGLAWPGLLGFLSVLGQSDSMEAGENQYAFAYRTVLRQHKIGYEIKNGPQAGSPKHHFKATDAANIAKAKAFKGMVGFRDFFSNFDHNIDVLFSDPKKYDAAKWQTIVQRLGYWLGPVGLVMAFKNMSPDWTGMVRSQCLEARRNFRPWLEEILGEGFKVRVKVGWGNECFNGGRLQNELLKWAVQQGFGSNTTAANMVFGDQAFEEEMANKKAEHKRARELAPVWDPNHGTGGKPPLTKPGGRPGSETEGNG